MGSDGPPHNGCDAAGLAVRVLQQSAFAELRWDDVHEVDLVVGVEDVARGPLPRQVRGLPFLPAERQAEPDAAQLLGTAAVSGRSAGSGREELLRARTHPTAKMILRGALVAVAIWYLFVQYVVGKMRCFVDAKWKGTIRRPPRTTRQKRFSDACVAGRQHPRNVGRCAFFLFHHIRMTGLASSAEELIAPAAPLHTYYQPAGRTTGYKKTAGKAARPTIAFK